MKYFATASLVASTLAAYVPSEPWSTLTPKAAAPSGATTDHTHSFGIQIVTLSGSATASASATTTASAKGKRDGVAQISDGQVQAQSTISLSHPTHTATVVNQISDGQIQHQTTATPAVVQQISDGQIQHQTAAVVQQISDGQIQHQTTAAVVQQISDGQIQHQTTAAVVNQISDGQIQHQTTATVVQQISDGQIQHQTTTLSTATVAAQISDGQIQHQTTSTVAGASQISDGQVQATSSADADAGESGAGLSCATANSLSMTLKKGELVDSKGRIGAIVANRQFQFDGPPPQAGTIYAGGWSVTAEGNLAIGDETTFYQCLSGDFYNLYDQTLGAQCVPVHLKVIDLITC